MNTNALDQSIAKYLKAKNTYLIVVFTYIIVGTIGSYTGAFAANPEKYPGHLLQNTGSPVIDGIGFAALTVYTLGVVFLSISFLKRLSTLDTIQDLMGSSFKKLGLLERNFIHEKSLLADPTDYWFQETNDDSSNYFSFSSQVEFTAVLETPINAPHILFLSKHIEAQKQDTFAIAAKTHQLEGDFGNHYNFYVPEGLEIDALRIMSPDNMAALIDIDYPLNIEFIHNKMILRSTAARNSGSAFADFITATHTLAKSFSNELMVYSGDQTDSYINGINLNKSLRGSFARFKRSMFRIVQRYYPRGSRFATRMTAVLGIFALLLLLAAPWLLGMIIANVFHG